MPQLDLLTWETHLFSLLLSASVGYFLVNHFVLPNIFVSFHVQTFCLYNLENILFSVNSYLFFISCFDTFFKSMAFNLKVFFNFFFTVLGSFLDYLFVFCFLNTLVTYFRISCLSFFKLFVCVYVYFLFANTRHCFYLMFLNSLE